MVHPNTINIYVDSAIEAKKIEIFKLHDQLQNLTEEKLNVEKMIMAFNKRQHEDLGELLEKILEYRRRIARGTPKEEETKKVYEEFKQQSTKSQEEVLFELTSEELSELKKKYRRASKLCHPDMVNESQKELAEKIFADLNHAYESNDLQKVSEVLDMLEGGNFFAAKTDLISEKELLDAEIKRLEILIDDIQKVIDALKSSKVYLTIINIEDWDGYFLDAKSKLEEQVKQIRNE